MHKLIVSFYILLFTIPLAMGQSHCNLYLQQNKLVGSTENKFFTGFEIELDSTYTKLDSASLFNQFPRIGSINFKNRIDIPTEFTITERAGFPQILFRFKSSYMSFDNLLINDESISFTFDIDPEVPVTEDDLKIIQIAKKLLSEEKYWNKNDDRNCDDDLANKSFSLYCALRLSSLEVENKYNHRNAALQKLRHLIEIKYPDKEWNHRLMDFNNMEETDYEEIINILNEIENSFIQELKSKK